MWLDQKLESQRYKRSMWDLFKETSINGWLHAETAIDPKWNMNPKKGDLVNVCHQLTTIIIGWEACLYISHSIF